MTGFLNRVTVVHRAMIRIGAGLLCAFLIGLPGTASAAEQGRVEAAEVKAAFLFNFAIFVNWPESAFADATSPIQYCSTAGGRSARALRRAVLGEQVGARPLGYRQVGVEDNLADCHVLYLEGLTGLETKLMIDRTVGRPVLTVSDQDAFAESGGIIEFNTQAFSSQRRFRVQTRINITEARRSGLNVSSKLLRLSSVVDH